MHLNCTLKYIKIISKQIKNECYLVRQDSVIYKLSFSSIEHDRSKLQKQIRKLLML